MFYKKVGLKNLTKFTGKHLCQSLFFNKVAVLRLATLLKKRLWHRCFPVNFAKLLRISPGDCFSMFNRVLNKPGRGGFRTQSNIYNGAFLWKQITALSTLHYSSRIIYYSYYSTVCLFYHKWRTVDDTDDKVSVGVTTVVFIVLSYECFFLISLLLFLMFGFISFNVPVFS